MSGDTSKHLRSSCNLWKMSTKGGSTSFMPTLWFHLQPEPWKSKYVSCWVIRVGVPGQTLKGLDLTTTFLLKLHRLSDSSVRNGFLVGCPEAALRKEASAGDPAPGPWVLGDFTLVLKARGWATIFRVHRILESQSVSNQTV